MGGTLEQHPRLASTKRTRTWGTRLAPDGFFEFRALARGVYALSPSVKGYDVSGAQSMEFLIEGDVSNLEVMLQPVARWKR